MNSFCLSTLNVFSQIGFIVSRKFYIIGLGVIVTLVLVFLSLVDPATSVFAPKCMFRYLTGYDCPACGIQRAVHALLNGDIATALRYNYFLLISIPYFIAVVITTFCKADSIEEIRYYVQHPKVVKIILALIIIWWVVRNIPYVKICFGML